MAFRYTPKDGQDTTVLGCVIPGKGLVLPFKLNIHKSVENLFDIEEIKKDAETIEEKVVSTGKKIVKEIKTEVKKLEGKEKGKAVDPATVVEPVKTEVETKVETEVKTEAAPAAEPTV